MLGVDILHEDAAVIVRCLDGVSSGGVAEALKLYERTRKPRTSWIQAVSSSNDIVQIRERQDELYEYDAWTAPLAARSMARALSAFSRSVGTE